MKSKGVVILYGANLYMIPSNEPSSLKMGVELNNDVTKSKVVANLRTLLVEATSVYKALPSLNVGMNLHFDAKKMNLDKYDFGFSWEAAAGAQVGVKHESISKDKIQPGKFLLYFHHAVSSAQTVGSEFVIDYLNNRAVTARMGYLHKFNDDTSAKVKVNHAGQVDLAFKHVFGPRLTAGFISGFNLNTLITQQKTKTLPLGFSVDLKF